MSHKRPSKHLRAPRPLSAAHAAMEVKADGAWVVRTVPGAAALKAYRCPGCSQVVTVGTAHIVAWPHQPSTPGESAVAERRHWHSGCWRRKR